MSERGPVGTAWPDLAYQGGFRVFKEGGEGLDDMYEQFGPFVEGKLKSRSRIAWVEIDTSLDAIDVARVHFIDPERRVAGYVAELWTNPEQRLETWKVMIGYHFLPESRWLKFTGVPVIEDTEFPQNGPPEVTVRLFAPSIAMVRRNTALGPPFKPTRHWAFGPDKPYSVKKALQTMAEVYGLSLMLGSLERVIDLIDSLYEERFKNPTTYRQKLVDTSWLNQKIEGPGISPLRSQSGRVADERRLTAVKEIMSKLDSGAKGDRKDWDYLVFLAAQMQGLVNVLFDRAERTGGINDTFYSKPSSGGNQIVFGIREDALYFCRLRDLDPRIDEITMFSYQVLDHSLLSFRVLTEQVGGGADAVSGLAKILALREEAVAKAQTDKTETQVKTGSDDPETRYDVSGQTDPAITKTAGTNATRSASALRVDLYKTATEEEILGMLATNLSAEAEVVGAPFLCAGKLVATYGLGVTGESKPDPEKPERINMLDRVWFVVGCTHRVDSTGFYKTTLRIAGASTDDSKDIPRNIADMTRRSVDTAGQKTKNKTFWERLMTWDWGS